MKQKELTNIFMMISNLKTPFGLHGLYKKYFSALRVSNSEKGGENEETCHDCWEAMGSKLTHHHKD